MTHVLILIQCFIYVKSILRKKFGSSHYEISVFCTRKEYKVTTPNYPFFLYYLSSGRLHEAKSKRNFQTSTILAKHGLDNYQC